MAKATQEKGYPFTGPFELAVTLAEASVPRFHDLIGHALEPNKMPTESARLIVMAAHSVADRTGAGCTSSVLAIQQLRSLCDKGKLTFDELEEASDYLDTAEDLEVLGDIEDLITELTPILKRSMHKELVQTTIQDYGKGKDVEETAEEFNKVATLGTRRASLGQGLVASAEDVRSALKTRLVDPLPTGVFELDSHLGGGLEKGALGVVVGPTGSGKSMFLSSLSVEAMISGFDVAYMTLELSEAQVKRRFYSNFTDMTVEDMIDNPDECAHRLHLWQMEGIGDFRVLYETPKVTSPHHVRRWLRDLEREENFKPRVLIIDYADRMVSKVGSNKSLYEEMGIVYEELRNIAVALDGWSWTASQAKGEATGKRKIGSNMAADSLNKIRVCDLQVGLARTTEDEENDTVNFNIGKRREGEDHHSVGPLNRDCARGRIIMVPGRENPWE